MSCEINGMIIGGSTSPGLCVSSPPITTGDLAMFSSGNVLSDSGLASGNVVLGPASAVSGDLPKFADTTGKLLSNSGLVAQYVVQCASPSVTGDLVSFSDNTGVHVTDSGVHASAVVTGPGSATDGDIVTFSGTTGRVIQDPTGFSITSGSMYLPTTGGTAAGLNFYETNSNTYQMTGIWASPQTVTIDLTRIGNLVTFCLQTNAIASATTAGMISLVSYIPSRFAPLAQFYSSVLIKNNNTLSVGQVIIGPSNLEVQTASLTNFSGLSTFGPSGVFAFSVSYVVS